MTDDFERRASGESAMRWVAEHMPDESAAALAGALKQNPRLVGAQWPDFLEMLLDTDSHAGMREDLHEDLSTDDTSMLPSAVMLTLLYSGKLLGLERGQIADLVKETLARPIVATVLAAMDTPEAAHGDPVALFEYPEEPPMLSIGAPSTLGTWYDMTKAVFGEDSPAVEFWQQKIDSHAKGRDEWVVSDEGQTLYLVGQIHFNGLPSGGGDHDDAEEERVSEEG